MVTTKKIGICMDHSSANLIEFSKDPIESKFINSNFTHEDKQHSLFKSENLMHNKEQHEQSEYFRQLGEVIRNYDEVILFGQTQAKQELLNTLKSNHHFKKIKIKVQNTDKMSINEQHAFVKKHFKKTLFQRIF